MHNFYFLHVCVVQGGVALVLCGLCLSVLQKKWGRRLSVDVGGAKRLQALSTLVVAVMLMPWALVQVFTQEVCNAMVDTLPVVIMGGTL